METKPPGTVGIKINIPKTSGLGIRPASARPIRARTAASWCLGAGGELQRDAQHLLYHQDFEHVSAKPSVLQYGHGLQVPRTVQHRLG